MLELGSQVQAQAGHFNHYNPISEQVLSVVHPVGGCSAAVAHNTQAAAAAATAAACGSEEYEEGVAMLRAIV